MILCDTHTDTAFYSYGYRMDFRMTLVCFCGSAVVCPFGYWTIYRQQVGFLIRIEN